MIRSQLTKLAGLTWMCFAAGLLLASGGTLENSEVMALAALLPPLMLAALASERPTLTTAENLRAGARPRS